MNPTAANFTPVASDGRSHQKKGSFQDIRSQTPCIFFQRGGCRNGNTCPFSHAKPVPSESWTRSVPIVGSSTAKSVADPSATGPAPLLPEHVTRTLHGAVVHFGAGASATKISLSSDFSAVQISPLAHGSTRASVLRLLQSHGIDVPDASEVRISHQKTFSSAKLTVDDPEFAKPVVAKLGAHVASRRSSQGTAPVATVVETSMLSGSSDLRVDCKRVHCSWHKPCKTVWLNFGNGDIAERVSKGFKDGKYTIAGQRVTSASPTGGERGWVGGLGYRNPKAWTVCLTQAPASATEEDIYDSISSQYDRPRDVKLGLPSYDADVETCSATIQSLFTKIGPLEWWGLTPDKTGRRELASARFQAEEDAREAVRSLNKSQLPFNKNAKLTVNLVHSAKFKVRSAIYEVTRPQIMANIRKWKESHLTYNAYENPHAQQWYQTLRIDGEGAEDVAEAMKTIKKILDGTIAKDRSGPGSSALWHPALRSSGLLHEKIDRLRQQTGVSIFPDRAKSQIRLYGAPEKCEKAQTALVDMLKAEKSECFEVELDAEGFAWALKGGCKMIANELGSKSVKLDPISTPKRITITGTLNEYTRALLMMNDRPTQLDKKTESKGQDCSVCWTEAENPVQTQCKHVYCLDCFENLCMSATTQNSAVSVQCAGQSGTCATVLGLPELQEHLSSTAFDQLLEQSFASYVRRSPHLLRHCPSADCGYVYRVSSAPKMQNCLGCLVPVCTACHAQHGTVTCADYRDISTGGYAAFEKLKKEMGIKDCPKCSTPLEKIDGCDHMACKCGAHICWVCLQTFADADVCYDHMKGKHGGIGLGHYQRMFG
ncbi:hypothetical protein GGR54DRAFT_79731 [Hypoxylon sp. NC1633]|nr:hypothetical protein GGR54DRAFT_79731 [Hypoxylon sp. NC1633]